MASRTVFLRLTQTPICISKRAKSSAVSVSMLEDFEITTEWDRARPYWDIPGPKTVPFLGNTWRFIPFIGDYKLEEVDKVCKRLHKQYGKIVRLSGLLGRPDMVFLFDPDDVEKVFRHEELMPYRPSMPSLNYYKHVLRKDFFGDNAGVIAVHGENWYSFRSKVQHAMLQPRTAKLYINQIEKTANAFVERSRSLKDHNDEMPDNFMNEIHKWSLESIARIALDTRLGCLDNDTSPESDTQMLINAVTTFFANVGILELKIPFWKLFPTPTWNKYIHSLDTITSVTLKYIQVAIERCNVQRHEKSDEEPSLLQKVLAIDPDPKTACVLALDMFLVGIDTTSTAVASILYQLALHPDKQEILHKEILKVLPHPDTPLTSQNIEELIYLRAVIKETLRMFPVVIGNGRCMTRDTVISGYRIPRGTQVVFQHYVMSNLEKYFNEADKFIPERWLKNSTTCPVTDNRKIHPFASLPFGYGRRMCIGRRFAELEIQAVIAKMIQAYKIEYHHEPLEYRIHPMYTPDGPLKLRLIDRQA